jgi:hypothetical protein
MISADGKNKNTFYSLIVLDKKQDMENKLYNLTDEIDVKYKFANKYHKNT